MYLTAEFHKRKRSNLRERMAKEDVEGVLALDPFNVMYLTGFHHIATERPIGAFVPLNSASILFIPRLEENFAQQAWPGELRVYPEFPGEVDPITWMCSQISCQALGVDNVSATRFRTIRATKPRTELFEHIGEMRLTKDPEELEFIARAAEYADFAVSCARDAITERWRRGITEREVLAHLKHETVERMQRDHEDHPDYPLSCGGTVHAGERGAFPHGMPTGRRIQAGDTIIVGIGCAVAGYHAESACTFIVGSPSSDQKRWMDTAIAIRRVSVEELRPGVPCGHVDDLHLNLMQEMGMAAFNRHRLGHGIGLQNHEPPWIQSGDRRPLIPGMVVSSEPGVYVPDQGGVRLIDTFVITEDSNRVVSQYMAGHLDDYVIPA